MSRQKGDPWSNLERKNSPRFIELLEVWIEKIIRTELGTLDVKVSAKDDKRR